MPNPTSSRRRHLALIGLRGILALVFFSAGLAKLVGVPALVAAFEEIGWGQWFRYVTGLIELGGAGLLLTRLVGLGAAVLACTMTGAVIAHLTVASGSPVPAAILLLLSGVVAIAYRDRTLTLVRASVG